MSRQLNLGERKFVEIVADVCNLCNQERLCLECDNSDWEYLPITLCLPCIQQLFKGSNSATSSAEPPAPPLPPPCAPESPSPTQPSDS